VVDAWFKVQELNLLPKAMAPEHESGVTAVVMDPGSSSGVTADVIPASAQGSTAPAHPGHCEPSVSLVEPLVLDLNPDSWNKPFTLSAEQLSELNLPTGESNVTVTLNLSNLLGAEAAPTQLTATGTLHEGQAFTYHADATLQAMIDQQ
jgi:hypothetical protein